VCGGACPYDGGYCLRAPGHEPPHSFGADLAAYLDERDRVRRHMHEHADHAGLPTPSEDDVSRAMVRMRAIESGAA